MPLLRTIHLFVLALALAVTGVGISSVTASSGGGSAAFGAGRPQARALSHSFESEVLRLTNAARQRHGLRPLVSARCVEVRAGKWSRTMAARDRFRHQSMRSIQRACHRGYVGENIAMGRRLGARQVVNLWMHSRGHRANILNRHYRYLGVGAYRSTSTGRVYVTQNFLR